MHRLFLQRRHCLWPLRSWDHPHTSRYHGLEESASPRRQAQLQSRSLICRRLPHPVNVARNAIRFSRRGHGLDSARNPSCHTLTSVDAPSNSQCRPFLDAVATTQISPTGTDDSESTIGGGKMMARSTRPAAGQTRRGIHTAAAWRASPAASPADSSPLSDIVQVLEAEPSPRGKKAAAALDPESDQDVPADVEEVKESLSRPPPVNSDYLPLPWKGRLGYACLCTYLRHANPPVFSSRTCRLASILDHRHPLQDPSQPHHPTKNRPDRDQPADVARGQAYVEALGLANARDIVKMLRWNDRYGIKFLRLSSEMFPFASHEIYGYKLAPFASEVLAEAGRVAAELGHRLTMHPGQFTQLGSPRKQVIDNSIRDLAFHSELLQLLKLPPQQDRDAVMILHMGGVFGDKAATLDRFRENYKRLSQDIKNRLVLENDDVSWSVHDLLPICEELNIPMVLDFHHHNIIFDSDKLREGTLDIMQLYDRIRATWTRKGITQKMHYSEPTPEAITPRQRRKHNPRVAVLPPCDPTMDLMIEAKDKEQAVFELMRKYQLPGHESFTQMTPHLRDDENTPWKPPRKTKKSGDFVDLHTLSPPPATIPPGEVNMGGPEGKVYWPPGKKDWLRPARRILARKATDTAEAIIAPKKNPETQSKPSPRRKARRAIRDTKTTATSSTRKRKSSEGSVSSTSANPPEPCTPPLTKAPGRRSRRAKGLSYAEDESV